MCTMLVPDCGSARANSFKIKSFRAPPAPESLSLCVAKEKVTQEKGHPAWRLPGIPARQVREPGQGFSTARPCTGEKESASCQFPLRGLSTPTHRRTGAPGRAAGHPCPHSARLIRGRTCHTRVTTSVAYPVRSSWETTSNPNDHPCAEIGM